MLLKPQMLAKYVIESDFIFNYEQIFIGTRDVTQNISQLATYLQLYNFTTYNFLNTIFSKFYEQS